MSYVPKSRKLRQETVEELSARVAKMSLPEKLAFLREGELAPVSQAENKRRSDFARKEMLEHAEKHDTLVARAEHLESLASKARAAAEAVRIPSERERLIGIVSKMRDRPGKVRLPPAFVAEKTESEDEEETLDNIDANFMASLMRRNHRHFNPDEKSFRPPVKRNVESEQRSAARRDAMRESMSKFGQSDTGITRLEGVSLPEYLRGKDAEEREAYGRLEGEGMRRPIILRRRNFFPF